MNARLSAFVASGNDADGGYRPVNAGQWHPTVSFLALMVIAEILAFGWLRYYFRSAHGG